MKLIVGLGNLGEQYEKTRHNLGFMVIEQFLKDAETVKNTVWTDDKSLKSDIALLDWQPRSTSSRPARPLERIILAKPKTYMNNSGMSVQLIASFYKVDSSDILVIHDDLDLPLGKMKIRLGGAAAGHHGVEDIIEKLGTDKFWRFRLGIGESRHSAAHIIDDDGTKEMISRRNMGNTNDFVLGEFTGQERSEVKKLIKCCCEAVEVTLEKGMESAMNRFNTK